MENHKNTQVQDHVSTLKIDSQKSSLKRKSTFQQLRGHQFDLSQAITPLDKQRIFTRENLSTFTLAKENMQKYMDCYSQTFHLPSLYVQNQLFFKPEPEFIIQVVQYVYPDESEGVQVNQHYLDGRSEIRNFDDIYNSRYGAYLKLVRVHHNELHSEQEIQISKTAKKIAMEFSEDSKYLGISYIEGQKTMIRVISCENQKIKTLMDNFENQNFKMSHDLDTTFIQNLTFDRHGKYLVGYGDQQVLVMDLEGKEPNKPLEIQTDYFEKIYHLRYESFDDRKNVCYVACKKNGIKQICLFNLNNGDVFNQFHHECTSSDEEDIHNLNLKKNMLSREEQLNDQIQILTFFEERNEHLKIMISSDCQKVAFCNANENFLIEKRNGVTLQKNLPQLKDKIVRFIASTSDGSEFYFVACHDYDTGLEIQTTSDINFELTIPRSVEPGIIKIFDIYINSEENLEKDMRKSSLTNHVSLLSLKDDDTVYDKMDYELKASYGDLRQSVAVKMDVETKIYNQIIQQNMKAYSFEWPYVCFSGIKNNYLFILNVFDSKTIHRVQLNEDDEFENSHFKVLATCITTTNDLYVLSHCTGKYQIRHLDLDESNQLEHINFVKNMFKQEIVFEYSAEDVNKLPFKSFHSRGSSIKEKIDTNHKLVMFVHHGEKLFSCVQLNHNPEVAQPFPKLSFVSNISSNQFYFINDSKFLFLETIQDQNTKQIKEQNIKQVEVYFRFFQCETILKESSVKEEIISFNIDQEKHRLFLLTESWNENLNRFDSKVFKIYSMKKKKIIFETKIVHEPLIQRLKSGLYTLVDGHIYFNNNVIKIRYDLMEKKDSHILLEDEVFDYYTDIFQLKKGERVKSGTPLDSIMSHKMAYIMSDKENFSTSKVKYTPYLHEKKLFLNRIKMNTDYFYTSLKTVLKDAHSDNGKDLTTIIVLNITERKMYAYTQNGIILNRVVFKKEARKYGEPISTSSNGLNFIFKRSQAQLKENASQKKDQWLFNIMSISMFGVRFLKEINIIEKYQLLVGNRKSWFDQYVGGSTEKMPNLEYQINDNLDVMVKITDAHQKENQSDVIFVFISNDDNFKNKKMSQIIDQEEMSYFSLKISHLYVRKSFCYIHNCQNEEWRKNKLINPLKKQSKDIHESKMDLKKYKFVINTDFFILYNEKTIHYYELNNEDFERLNLKDIDLQIGEEEIHSKIKGIHCGSNSKEIMIIIDSTIETDLMIEWDMVNNTETNSYDVGKEYQIFFDGSGDTIVATQHHCLMNGTIIKAFECDANMFQSPTKSHGLGMYHGHRFDHNNHNWLINQKFMSMPFSYMSFVIKNAIEEGDTRSKLVQFDIQPYNYIFNRSSSFLDSKFVMNNHLNLEEVLKKCMSIEPDIIDALSYVQAYNNDNEDATQEQKKYYPNLYIAPLTKAVKSDNNRCTALLLDYMSNIDHDISTLIQDLFPKLIDQHTFQKFLTKMSVQTIQMREKQFLTVSQPQNRDYVRMNASQSLYVDGYWFQQNMKEETNGDNKNYPVEVKAMKIRWFILSQYGYEFLQQILKNENLDLYNIPTLRIIIEYFYSQYKRFLYRKDLPIFIVKFVLFLVTAILYESIQSNDFIKGQVVTAGLTYYLLEFLLVMLVFVQCLQFYYFYEQFQHGREIFLNNYQNYTNMLMTILFLLYAFFTHVSLGFVNDTQLINIDFVNFIKGTRYTEIGLVFFLTIRFFNFLQLNDNTSPLMDIIYRVFSDIMYFVVVFFIVICSCATSFYLLGQLQMDFDELTTEEKDSIPYGRISSAIWYIWFTVLGQPDIAMYGIGKGTQFYLLRFLFTFTIFFLIILMLNMLIAIMGNTFAVRSGNASQIRMRDHLKFVIANWHLSSGAFQDKAKLKYIVTAFAQDTSLEDENIGELIKSEASVLLDVIRDSSLSSQIQQSELELKVLSLSHAVSKLTSLVQKQYEKDGGEASVIYSVEDGQERSRNYLPDIVLSSKR